MCWWGLCQGNNFNQLLPRPPRMEWGALKQSVLSMDVFTTAAVPLWLDASCREKTVFRCSSPPLEEAQPRASQPLQAAVKPHNNSSCMLPPVQLLYVASCTGGTVSVPPASLCCLTYCWSNAERRAGWRCSMEAVREVSIVSPLTSSPWMTVTDGSLA